MNEELRLYNAVSAARRAIQSGMSDRIACADAAAYWGVHADVVRDYVRPAEKCCEASRRMVEGKPGV